MTLVLGIDTSTTATKALLMDDEGAVRSVASSSYEFQAPQPAWSEQDPELWWDATVRSIRDVLAQPGVEPSEIGAIGLTGQMHGSVLLDSDDAVVRPAILWNDQRTSAECEEIRDRVGRQALIQTSGNDALTGLTAPKLLWVRRHEPNAWERVATVMLPKDYLRLKLTGRRATDVADGSGTGLFDLQARTWSKEILDALDLDADLFPDTFEGPEITGTVSDEAADITGLVAGTSVVAGGGDQSANGVGVGAVRPGVVALSLGTSGVVFATSTGPTVDPQARVQAFCHAVPGRWHMMGVMLSAGGSLRWLRDTVAPGESFESLVESAAAAPPGSEGLVFLPYLTGERTPHPDPKARGAFVGLTVSHGLSHMTRAVLEGVAFGLRDGLELMVAAGTPRPSSIRASGGGVSSPLWRQILADVLGTSIETLETKEGAAYGAAILASVGAGVFPTVDVATGTLISTEPGAESGGDAGLMEQRYAQYRELYPALRPWFHESD